MSERCVKCCKPFDGPGCYCQECDVAYYDAALRVLGITAEQLKIARSATEPLAKLKASCAVAHIENSLALEALGITKDQWKIAMALDYNLMIRWKEFIINAKFDHLIDPSGRWEATRREMLGVILPTFDTKGPDDE